MAIVITRPTAGVASTANTSSYVGPILTPTANSLLIAFVSATGSTTPGILSGGSLTWIQINNTTFDSGVDLIIAFYAVVGTSPVSTTPTYATAGGNATGCSISVLMVTGHDTVTVNPIKQNSISSSAGIANANINTTFSTALITTNAYIAGMGGQLTTGAVTPPTSWTLADDLAYITPAANMETAYRVNGETGNTITFTNATTKCAMIGIEIYNAGTGPLTGPLIAIKNIGLLGIG